MAQHLGGALSRQLSSATLRQTSVSLPPPFVFCSYCSLCSYLRRYKLTNLIYNLYGRSPKVRRQQVPQIIMTVLAFSNLILKYIVDIIYIRYMVRNTYYSGVPDIKKNIFHEFIKVTINLEVIHISTPLLFFSCLPFE